MPSNNYCARYQSVPVYAEGRVEHQKRTQTASTLWPFGFVLVFNSVHKKMHGVDYNQCLCLPKAKFNTKPNPNGHHFVAVWVRFGFQLGLRQKLALIIMYLDYGAIWGAARQFFPYFNCFIIGASHCHRPSWKPKRTQTHRLFSWGPPGAKFQGPP